MRATIARSSSTSAPCRARTGASPTWSSGLPRYRAKEITTGRVALKATAPAVGRVPGVVGRAELINAVQRPRRADRERGRHRPGAAPGQVHPLVPRATRPIRAICRATRSSRGSRPPSGSTCASILDREDALVELDDNETVAAGVMLTLGRGRSLRAGRAAAGRPHPVVPRAAPR